MFEKAVVYFFSDKGIVRVEEGGDLGHDAKLSTRI